MQLIDSAPTIPDASTRPRRSAGFPRAGVTDISPAPRRDTAETLDWRRPTPVTFATPACNTARTPSIHRSGATPRCGCMHRVAVGECDWITSSFSPRPAQHRLRAPCRSRLIRENRCPAHATPPTDGRLKDFDAAGPAVVLLHRAAGTVRLASNRTHSLTAARYEPRLHLRELVNIPARPDIETMLPTLPAHGEAAAVAVAMNRAPRHTRRGTARDWRDVSSGRRNRRDRLDFFV